MSPDALTVRPARPSEVPAALRQSAENDCLTASHRIALWEAGELDAGNLLVCVDDSEALRGALLVQADSANSALAWPPIVEPRIESALFDGLKFHARLRGWTGVMSFLDEGDAIGLATLKRGGFEEITTLQDLRYVGTTQSISDESDLTWHDYRAVDPEQFARVFAETQVDSLDCPEVSGPLAGYHVSAPDLRRWWLVRHRGEDAGVVLLADAAEVGWEIAYLGLVPTSRSRGLGGRLLHQIIMKCSQMGITTLHVRVDGRNLPALRLYAKFGFRLQRSHRVCLLRRF